jgi:hypothetical protein
VLEGLTEPRPVRNRGPLASAGRPR